ncbi:hypothetical protein L6452_15383 [Arctium lappa]|uniref:Uncharacterized protein n=1 Tax=Arctium lappa TaxID=4217 RepID=A0ACB9CNK2_ARCLA|nr:hypothetical protein L6452_15383 [Arctium lappa]
MIGNCSTKRILVDGGSSANIIFLSTIKAMGIDKSEIVRRSTVLVGFNKDMANTIGEIILPIFAKGVNKQTKFNIVDCSSAYNIILGQPWIHDMKAMPSTYPGASKKSIRLSTRRQRRSHAKEKRKVEVCIDFTDLNKACSKDPFPLPHIDSIVDATAGHELLTFMDAYSRYNQMLMHRDDQEKTTFMTDKGIYCYKVMPFGLKNA